MPLMALDIHEPLRLRSRREFFWHQLRYVGAGTGFLLFSLSIGILGYHFLAGIDWIDSLLNASMILSGMGPVSSLHGTVAKLFASVYALYSGVVYLAVSAVLLYPLVQRLLKILHLQALNTAASKHARSQLKQEE
ncbi:hypothetical protein [Candidatus Igneacidithiobacillus taiwanensis]|uniref:hypothetical protein n=1 Tax=Candidatus Igneacidithiobacillus taiwanensis TaxID=1945924 RepID=UPI002899C62F|nr:hypothetical protein [Candidatus Igneacidithiobacillus taiwanensis]